MGPGYSNVGRIRPYDRNNAFSFARSCPPCSVLFEVMKRVKSRLADAILRFVTGFNRLERLLSGESFLDLVLYRKATTPLSREEFSCKLVKEVEAELFAHLGSEDGKRLLLGPTLLAGVNTLGTDVSSATLLEATKDEIREIRRTLPVKDSLVERLRLVIKQARIAQLARTSLNRVREQPFENDPADFQMVEQIWCTLRDDEPPRHGNSTATWADIGFQHHPSSDFRGMGRLGAINLHYFVTTYRPRAFALYKESCDSQSRLWFPFCITGLNVTSWVFDMLEGGLLDVFFYNNPNPPLLIFNDVYSFVFLEFTRFWRLSRPANILQFGIVARRFIEEISENFQRLADPGQHSEWSLPLTTTGLQLQEELKAWIDGDYVPKNGSSLYAQNVPRAGQLASLSV